MSSQQTGQAVATVEAAGGGTGVSLCAWCGGTHERIGLCRVCYSPNFDVVHRATPTLSETRAVAVSVPAATPASATPTLGPTEGVVPAPPTPAPAMFEVMEAATLPTLQQSQSDSQTQTSLDLLPVPEMLPSEAEPARNRLSPKPRRIELRLKDVPGLPPHTVPVVAATAQDRDQARNLRLPALAVAYERSLLTALGAATFLALELPWRAAVRLRALELAGARLSKRQKQVLLDKLARDYEDERRRAEAAAQGLEELRETLRTGSWLGVSVALHLLLLFVLWSVALSLLVTEVEEVDLPAMANPYAEPHKKDGINTLQNVSPLRPLPDERPDPELKPLEDLPDRMEPQAPSTFAGETIAPAQPQNDANTTEAMADWHKLSNVRIGTGANRVGTTPSGRPGKNPPGGSIISQRTGDSRESALKKYGGNPQTEHAVQIGLEWLAKQQQPNGTWVPNDTMNGPVYYIHGFTGLAMLCFLGNGHTHKTGKYTDALERAMRWLVAEQKSSGLIGPSNDGMMYCHTLATLALAELFAMTGDATLRPVIERALTFLEATQQASGGWDYGANKFFNRTDTSITGWAIMALKSALIAGFNVRDKVWLEAQRSIVELTSPTGEVLYCRTGRAYVGRRGVGMTAVGVLCRLYGRSIGTRAAGPDLSLSTRWLTQNPPNFEHMNSEDSGLETVTNWSDVPSTAPCFHSTYYWYYGTLAMFELTQGEGGTWRDWNAAMQKAILPNQRTDPADAERYGSWDAGRNVWAAHVGRLGTTCFNILTLEVYYRYLPLYAGLSAQLPGKLVDAEGNLVDVSKLAGGSADSGRNEPSAVEAILAILNDMMASDVERSQAVARLVRLRNVEAQKALGKSLSNPALTEPLRAECLRGLALLRATDQFDAVVNAAALAFNANLRAACYETVGKLRNAKAFEYLVAQMRTAPTSDLRAACARGLNHLTGKTFGPNPEEWMAWRATTDKLMAD